MDEKYLSYVKREKWMVWSVVRLGFEVVCGSSFASLVSSFYLVLGMYRSGIIYAQISAMKHKKYLDTSIS